jgi:NADH-quinone oxidoreductase subunit K
MIHLPHLLDLNHPATLRSYLVVAGLLFSLGLTGVLVRRNILIVFLSAQLMLGAACLSFAGFSAFLKEHAGDAAVFFIVAVAAIQIALGLVFAFLVYKNKSTLDIDKLDSLKW